MKRRFVMVFFFAALLYAALSMDLSFDLKQYKAFFQQEQMQFAHLDSSKLLLPQTLADSNDRDFYGSSFQSNDGFFVLVANDDTLTYVAPNVEEEVYEPLKQSMRVSVLYEKSQYDEIYGEERKWVFVANEKGTVYLGWMFKDQLVYPNQFKPMTKSTFKELHYQKGDLTVSTLIESNAWFKSDWSAQGGGLFMRGKETGRLYQYKNFIWAKKSDQDFLYDFFVLNDNQVDHENRFEREPLSMKLYTLD